MKNQKLKQSGRHSLECTRTSKKEKARNPLFFWRENQQTLPILAELARKWPCIPPSSASNKRVFSCGDNIVTAKRTKLMPENVDMLVYIQQNFDKVKITNWKLRSKDPLDQKPKTSSQSQSGAEDDDDLGVEFLPTTPPPPTDVAATQPPATGSATNPCPAGSGTQPRPTGPTCSALRQSLLKFKSISCRYHSSKFL